MYEFEIATSLLAPPETVWKHAIDLRGVNRELMPLCRMTYPPGQSTLGEESPPLHQKLFRSWILLFGILPIDYDDLALEEFVSGKHFQEASTMLTQSVWRHRRSVEPTPNGCIVRDRLQFVPRVALLGPLHLLTFRLAFRIRHRNLRKVFRER